ncbi:MAG: hypothetical protein V3S73_02340 [Gammaproteobacteria bacterium]|jgi:hypothetical protein|nr:hypothetical protein [Pseudomonadota bacterium]MCZ6731232.1 hypothetical protein [Gammaproteobacteria bacterium]
MTTGIESWAGNISEIGPMYPFVGTEVLLLIIGVVTWIGWHIWQSSNETRTYEEEKQRGKR